MKNTKKIIFGSLIFSAFFLMLEVFLSFSRGPTDHFYFKNIVDKHKLYLPKKENEIRIFSYGGSVMAGWPATHIADPMEIVALDLKAFMPQDLLINSVNFAHPGRGIYDVYSYIKLTKKYDPDVIIVYSGHNEFLEINRKKLKVTYKIKDFFRNHLRSFQLISNGLRELRLKRIQRKTKQHSKEWEVVKVKQFDKKNRDEYYYTIWKDYPIVLKNYKKTVNKIVAYLSSTPIKLIICTPISNNRNLAPFASTTNPTLSELQKKQLVNYFEKGNAFYNQKKYKQAILNFHKALTIDVTYALAHYWLAKCYEALSKFNLAKKHYIAARDYDASFNRVRTDFVDVLRLYRNHRNVLLLDLIRDYEKESPSKILPMDDIFVDAVHMNMYGKFWLGQKISAAVRQSMFPHLRLSNGEKRPTYEKYIASKSLSKEEYDLVYEQMWQYLVYYPNKVTEYFKNEIDKNDSLVPYKALILTHYKELNFQESALYLKKLKKKNIDYFRQISSTYDLSSIHSAPSH